MEANKIGFWRWTVLIVGVAAVGAILFSIASRPPEEIIGGLPSQQAIQNFGFGLSAGEWFAIRALVITITAGVLIARALPRVPEKAFIRRAVLAMLALWAVYELLRIALLQWIV